MDQNSGSCCLAKSWGHLSSQVTRSWGHLRHLYPMGHQVGVLCSLLARHIRCVSDFILGEEKEEKKEKGKEKKKVRDICILTQRNKLNLAFLCATDSAGCSNPRIAPSRGISLSPCAKPCPCSAGKVNPVTNPRANSGKTCLGQRVQLICVCEQVSPCQCRCVTVNAGYIQCISLLSLPCS